MSAIMGWLRQRREKARAEAWARRESELIVYDTANLMFDDHLKKMFKG